MSCDPPDCRTFTDVVHYVTAARNGASGACEIGLDTTTTSQVDSQLNDPAVTYSFSHLCTINSTPASPDGSQHTETAHDPFTGDPTSTTVWSLSGVCEPPQVACCPMPCSVNMTCYRPAIAPPGVPPPVCPPP